MTPQGELLRIYFCVILIFRSVVFFDFAFNTGAFFLSNELMLSRYAVSRGLKRRFQDNYVPKRSLGTR
jgi:hypothetical protein